MKKTKQNITNSKGVTITNRTYKDGVFTQLFHEKSKICELYNAIHNTDKYKEADITIQTLSQALYKLYKDDLAFMVDNKFVILIEHQSTPSQNLPIRMLIYLARVYEILLDIKPVYSDILVKIPCPELYVLYNGEKDWPEEFTLKLSDAFLLDEKIEPTEQFRFLELNVKVININLEKHSQILENSKTLKEYSIFISKIRTYLHANFTRDHAIKMSIEDCIKENILTEFLKKHGGEIYNMIFQEFNMETALEIAKQDGITEGKVEGEIKGLEQGIKASLDLIKKFQIPKTEIKKSLYEAYPDNKDLVDKFLIHEELEEYK